MGLTLGFVVVHFLHMRGTWVNLKYYTILELVVDTTTSLRESSCWHISYSSKGLLPKAWCHHYRSSMVDIMSWLTVMEHLSPRWKQIFSLWQLSSFLFHRILHDQHGGCLIRNRRCLLYRCSWPQPWFLFGSVLFRHVYFGSCVVLVCCLCLYLCFQCCDCLRTILCDWRFGFSLTCLLRKKKKQKQKQKQKQNKNRNRQTKSNQIQKQTMGRYSW